MGDVNHGRAQVPLETDEFDAQYFAQFCVQVGEGFVHEKELGLAHDGASDCNALHFAAG